MTIFIDILGYYVKGELVFELRSGKDFQMFRATQFSPILNNNVDEAKLECLKLLLETELKRLMKSLEMNVKTKKLTVKEFIPDTGGILRTVKTLTSSWRII